MASKEAIEAAEKICGGDDAEVGEFPKPYEAASIIDAAFAERIAALVGGLESVRSRLLDLPSGIDFNADPDNASPDDMSAHIGGLCIQEIDVALDKKEEIRRIAEEP
jgi:hypothetical protein